jgi:ATP-dependent DNA helicase RecQ
VLGQLEIADGASADTAGGNSAYRLAGVWGRFHVGPDLATALSEAAGPVLLVDDLVDSRWTMTVAARELRRHGADSVLPFALAAVA